MSCDYSLGFCKCCARLHDDLFLYQDLSESDYLNKVTEETNCKYFAYEKERADHLKFRIDKLLQLCEIIKMSEQNRASLASQIMTVIKDVLDVIDDLSANAESSERATRTEKCLKISKVCEHGLKVLEDLCLPPVKPGQSWADLTDVGPGIGFFNYEVRFRDAELARIHNSDYRVRCHRSRGDSGQGEAERTNSAIADGLVDGATLEWGKFKRF